MNAQKTSKSLLLLFILFAMLFSPFEAHSHDPPTTNDTVPWDFSKPNGVEPPPVSRILVRGDWAYPPFEYLSKEGQPEGFTIDIVRAVAAVMNVDVSIQLGPWDKVREQLERGEIDALSGMYKTEEREKLVDFSIPHLVVSYAVFVRKNSTIQSIDDVKDKTIIVQNKDLGHDFLLENNVGRKIITLSNWEEVLRSLSQGKGDCAIVSRLQGVRLINKLKIKNVHAVGPPIIQRKYCIAVTEGNQNLLYAINEGLSIIKTTGTYDEIYQKWFKAYEGDPSVFQDAIRFAGLALVPLMAIVTLSLAWSWSLKRQVKLKTQALETELQERRKTETALSQSEERYRRLTDNARDMIYRMSLKDRSFEYVNPACRKITGYSAEQLMADPNLAPSLIHPDSREYYDHEWKRLMEGNAPPTYEYKIIDAFGDTRWLFQRNVLIRDDQGRPEAIEGIVTDMTSQKLAEQERRDLEAQLTRAEKMETIGTLAGGVAHDLNNILGAMVGYPDVLLEDLPSESPMRPALIAIKSSGEKAALIVQDLLTLARRAVTTNEIVNLNTLVAQYLESREYRRLLEYSPDISLDCSLDERLLNVAGSPVHLSKVIMNLVQNAGEAMPSGGCIKLTTENIYLDLPVRGYDTVDEGDYVLLRISDNGIGMTETDLKHVFEPFYTRKTMGHSGSGLGMAVVWSTVKDHRGYIDIQSALDKGTVVSVYLPVTRQEGASKSEPGFDPARFFGNREKILVIDDVAAQRDLAASMLEKLNYDVACVESGEEAVEYLQKHRADLLLLDMILGPGLDGLDTYLRILETYPGQKAVIASGFSETERVREAQRLGAGPYIKKPFTLEVIARALKAVFSG